MIRRLICKLFGHRWEWFGEHLTVIKGDQVWRDEWLCLRCGKFMHGVSEFYPTERHAVGDEG
jgi:Prophage protein (DUF1660)